MSASPGTVYVTYSQAAAYIDGLQPAEANALMERMGYGASPVDEALQHARGLLLPEYADKTLSSRIVQGASPTLYDRHPVAKAVMDGVIAKVESATGGYAADENPGRVHSIVWAMCRLADYAGHLESPEGLWSLAAALDRAEDQFFDADHVWELSFILIEQLRKHGIADPQSDDHRFCEPWVGSSTSGFMTVEEFDALVRAEAPLRTAVDKARRDFYHRFGDACGPFNPQKAIDCFKAVGSGHYFDSHFAARFREQQGLPPLPVHAQKARSDDPQVTAFPVSQGNISKREAFDQAELDAGYSPYGYWFSPEGGAFAMVGYQDHARWIAKWLGISTSGSREMAMRGGWVSMTMATELPGVANVAYMQESDCGKALKTAARMVRRGGDFSNVVIEEYDDEFNPVSYQSLDDRAGAQALRTIAKENNATLPRPI